MGEDLKRVECNPGKTNYRDSSWVMYMQTTTCKLTQMYIFVVQSPGKLFRGGNS